MEGSEWGRDEGRSSLTVFKEGERSGGLEERDSREEISSKKRGRVELRSGWTRMEIILHVEYICLKMFLWTKLHTITILILFSASFSFITSLFEHSINPNSFSNSSGC